MPNYSEHFSTLEMACRHCGKIMIDPSFLRALEELRVRMGFPFIVTSGYRCDVHNDAVGGAKDSSHVYGRAVDIAISGERAAAIVTAARTHGFTGLGIKQHGHYAGRFLHLDTHHRSFTVWSYA